MEPVLSHYWVQNCRFAVAALYANLYICMGSCWRDENIFDVEIVGQKLYWLGNSMLTCPEGLLTHKTSLCISKSSMQKKKQNAFLNINLIIYLSHQRTNGKQHNEQKKSMRMGLFFPWIWFFNCICCAQGAFKALAVCRDLKTRTHNHAYKQVHWP